jgi:hypothetical protein
MFWSLRLRQCICNWSGDYQWPIETVVSYDGGGSGGDGAMAVTKHHCHSFPWGLRGNPCLSNVLIFDFISRCFLISSRQIFTSFSLKVSNHNIANSIRFSYVCNIYRHCTVYVAHLQTIRYIYQPQPSRLIHA